MRQYTYLLNGKNIIDRGVKIRKAAFVGAAVTIESQTHVVFGDEDAIEFSCPKWL